MDKRDNSSAHRRVVEDYYRVTSASGAASSAAMYEEAVRGLERRLAHWLDVINLDVVDLGSGTGELCALAQRKGARSVVGINLSEEESEFASKFVDAEFAAMDIREYLEKAAPGSVDRIFALNILEHLDKDTLLKVLEEAYRCLRPGGALVAMVPNATSPFGNMTRYWDITHQLAFTPSSVRQLSRMAGFGESAGFRECGPVPHGLVSGIRFLLWRCIRFLVKGYLMVELASDKGGVYTADMMFRLSK